MREPVVMSWSGGKDSAMALYHLLGNADYEVVELMATVSEEYRRISHHGVREELLDAQAAAIGIPLRKVYLPSDNSAGCTNEVYETIMNRVMDEYKGKNVNTVAFGDLFLEDLRAWREANLTKVGMRGLFPIWKRDTRVMAHEVIRLGYKAYLSCVEAIVGADLVGRLYDENFLSDLPPTIDPCGENGEFHSFVFDGPTFARPLPIKVGERATRNGRFYADLLLETPPKLEKCSAESIPPV